MLNDFRIEPLGGGQPMSAVIFLHGYGDRGDGGMLQIGQVWQRALPHSEFICPDALSPLEMGPPDLGGRQWFSLQSLDPRDMEAGVLEAAPVVDAYIDHILETRQLEPRNLALVGFSQGAMMSLYVGPRRPQALGAIIGYSGLLPGASTLIAQKRSSPPILLVHGTADEVVPFQRMADAERGLKAANLRVRSLIASGVGHTIDEAGLKEGVRFLLENLGSDPI